MKFVDNAIRIGRRVVDITKHNAPTIAVVSGSIAVIAGGILACRATLKAEDIIDQHQKQMDCIKEATENHGDEYTDNDRKKDKVQVYASTAGKFARLYGPAVLLEAAGFAAIFGGFGLIKKRYGVALTTITTLDNRLADYRKKVIDRFGKEVDEEFTKQRGQFHEIEQKVVDEEGNETIKTINAINVDDIVEDDFTRIFDYRNPKWENSYLFNDNLFSNLEQWYTHNLQSNRMDHVFLNTILKELGFEETGIGHFYGWTNKPGCFVSFGVLPFIRMWDQDEDGQFPMIVPVTTEEGLEEFRQAYIDDEKSVGYILKFNIDCDENGVPREIYHDVYKD